MAHFKRGRRFPKHALSIAYCVATNLRACFGNDHRARAKTEKPAEMSELPPASPLTEAEASQEAASIYLQNTL